MVQALYWIAMPIDKEYESLVRDLIKLSCVFACAIFAMSLVHHDFSSQHEQLIMEGYVLSLVGLLFSHLVFVRLDDLNLWHVLSCHDRESAANTNLNDVFIFH